MRFDLKIRLRIILLAGHQLCKLAILLQNLARIANAFSHVSRHQKTLGSLFEHKLFLLVRSCLLITLIKCLPNLKVTWIAIGWFSLVFFVVVNVFVFVIVFLNVQLLAPLPPHLVYLNIFSLYF